MVSDRDTHRADIARIIRTLQAQFDLDEGGQRYSCSQAMEAGMAYEIGQTCMLVSMGLTRGECASWVQAWGAVVALAVAGAIAVGQIRATRTHAATVERNKRRALIEVIGHLARLLELEIESRSSLLKAQIDEHSRRTGFSSGPPFADVYDAAKAIPIHELPDVEVVRLAFDLRRLTALAISKAQRLVAEWDTTAGVFLRARAPLSDVLMGLQELRERCTVAASHADQHAQH
ncbi:hypothetical protein EJP67_02210 [Variovorax guangxiensis]|uniref:Uncharacterized protein n=1 Tax=Variovorax guangxiensis TaxID=1775474 RepID=A0A433MDF9_9BURK|nr:hypothetical protein [Variovorax guangxiensis]RUR65867.1 hypothetical protein EJP67_02210 [Variovorax guangxiensis]